MRMPIRYLNQKLYLEYCGLLGLLSKKTLNLGGLIASSAA